MGHTPRPRREDAAQHQAIEQDARPEDMSGLAVDRVLRRISDEPARIAHLVHHLVAGIDAGTAGNAFVLQAVADVDADRTDLHADGAVDAIAEFLRRELRQRLAHRRELRHAGIATRLRRGIGSHRVAGCAEHVIVGQRLVQQPAASLHHAAQAALSRAARFAAHRVVGDDQGVAVAVSYTHLTLPTNREV